MRDVRRRPMTSSAIRTAVKKTNTTMVMTRVVMIRSPPYQTPAGQEPDEDGGASHRVRMEQWIDEVGKRGMPRQRVVLERRCLPFEPGRQADKPVGDARNVEPIRGGEALGWPPVGDRAQNGTWDKHAYQGFPAEWGRAARDPRIEGHPRADQPVTCLAAVPPRLTARPLAPGRGRVRPRPAPGQPRLARQSACSAEYSPPAASRRLGAPSSTIPPALSTITRAASSTVGSRCAVISAVCPR